MDLQRAYDEVKRRTEAIRFEELWRGFHPFPFAFYDDEHCVLDGEPIEKPEHFLGNTSAMHDGVLTAIWNLREEPKDWDAMTASIVHEMFHAYQWEAGEPRGADDVEALFRYQYSPEALSVLMAESRLCERILKDGETSLYPELLRLRAWRKEHFPYEYDYQAEIEQIEGTANYVELAALTQLNPEKGKKAWEKAFRKLSEPENYVPIRIISYLTGASFLACIRRCSDAEVMSLTEEEPFASSVLKGVIPTKTPPAVRAELAREIRKYTEESRAIVRRALEKNEVLYRGKAKLNGINVWDARRDGKYVTSNFFFSYREGEEVHNLSGNFVIETEGLRDVLTIYRQ